MKSVNRISYSIALGLIGLEFVSPLTHGQTIGSGVDRHVRALEWRRMRLQNRNGEIPPDAWMKAVEEKKKMSVDPAVWPTGQGGASKAGSGGPSPKVAGVQRSGWTWLGPGNIGGLVTAILIDPTNPNKMWVGSPGGGIWKTVNAGASWSPVDDFMSSLQISCMAMDPTDAQVMYACTDVGIFKTVDAWTTWWQLPATSSAAFTDIQRLAFSMDGRILLAPAFHGVFRSTDGGTNWNPITIRTNNNFFDVAVDPSDSSKCVAAGFGFVAFSINGGLNWTSASGLTNGSLIELAYAPSLPNTVYASVNVNGGELWRSLDGGQTFSRRSTGYRYFEEFDGKNQGNYDNCVWVDPTNPNTLIVGGIDLWRSTDGGTTFNRISDGQNSSSAHVDQHVIVNHPGFDGAGNRTVFFGNDGGVYRSTDAGGSFTSLNHNLGITQFYGVAGSRPGGYVIGGTQDNGTIYLRIGDGTEGWQWVWDDDGGFCAVDPTDSGYYYGESQNLDLHRSGLLYSDISGGIADSGAGTTANFIAPFILDPNNPKTMLAGGLSLWRTLNVKEPIPGWSQIKFPRLDGSASGRLVSAIAVVSGDSDVIWVGHNDGQVFATANGTAVSPVWTRMGAVSLPDRLCSRITIDPQNSSVVYVTFTAYTNNNVWRTVDGGTTWASISSNLPQVPIHTLVVDPQISNRLYVGTQIGVFGSADGGAHWSPSTDGPANTVVYELAWMGTSLLAATFGRGCYMITPAVWVDFSRNCPAICGDGSFAAPFNTLTLAKSVVSPGGTVFFKPSTSGNCLPGKDCFPMTISRPMMFEAVGGPATIGR